MSDRGIHAGHRQRLRERFLANGFSGFSDHEIIEVLLTFSIPRIDVNEHAHRLVERFGSLRGVLDADHEDLITVEGIGESSAILLKVIVGTCRRYASADNDAEFVYDLMSKVGDYAVRLYIGVSVEKLYAMLFDNQMKLIDTVMLAEGSANSVRINARTLAEKAIKKNASSVILIHNHPNGTPYPSEEDKRVSESLREILGNIDISLIDHIIVSGRFYRPVFEEKTGETKFAASKKFSYDKPTESGIRAAELIAASDISFSYDEEQ